MKFLAQTLTYMRCLLVPKCPPLGQHLWAGRACGPAPFSGWSAQKAPPLCFPPAELSVSQALPPS